MKLISTPSIEVNITKNNITIYNSYRIRHHNKMKEILKEIKNMSAELGYVYSRSVNSWFYEWRAHNLLYELGLFEERTKNVDLNENEPILKRIGYFILSIFYKG